MSVDSRLIQRIFIFVVIIFVHVSSLRLKMTGKIGFVGIGIMGKGMVKNLATKLSGDIVIWNR
jgi:glutamyl-tRNA reductase